MEAFLLACIQGWACFSHFFRGWRQTEGPVSHRAAASFPELPHRISAVNIPAFSTKKIFTSNKNPQTTFKLGFEKKIQIKLTRKKKNRRRFKEEEREREREREKKNQTVLAWKLIAVSRTSGTRQKYQNNTEVNWSAFAYMTPSPVTPTNFILFLFFFFFKHPTALSSRPLLFSFNSKFLNSFHLCFFWGARKKKSMTARDVKTMFNKCFHTPDGKFSSGP